MHGKGDILTRPRILLVDDERPFLEILEKDLVAEGYDVNTAADGSTGIKAAMENQPDLVILDIMMPGMDGLEVCRKLRVECPDLMILFLTAKTPEEDMLKGFETGADDYLTKPVNLAELLARVKALLRRSENWTRQFVHRFADITCDSIKRKVTRAGNNISLSPMEFSLLWYFMEHDGETLERDRLLVEIWGYEAGSVTRTVDIHVARLRNKLEPDPTRPRHFFTVRGKGYKFKSEV